jgi:hypothetical protein
MSTTPGLWTPADAAAFLNVTIHQVAHLRRSAAGPPFIKVGRHTRYIPGAVARWASEKQQTTTTPKETTK